MRPFIDESKIDDTEPSIFIASTEIIGHPLIEEVHGLKVNLGMADDIKNI